MLMSVGTGLADIDCGVHQWFVAKSVLGLLGYRYSVKHQFFSCKRVSSIYLFDTFFQDRERFPYSIPPHPNPFLQGEGLKASGGGFVLRIELCCLFTGSLRLLSDGQTG
jgi:hypothetical protein